MKKIFFILSAVIVLCTNLAAQQTNEAARFKLFPTKNTWLFIKLDTGNGRTWLVQYSTDKDSRLEATLCDSPLILDPEPPAGRFELYPTENIYNFIMLDKEFGTTYQIQWGIKESDRQRIPISNEDDVVWSHGFTPIKVFGEWNFIDKNRNYLSKEFFKSVHNFNSYGYALVQRKDGKYNLLATTGKVQFKQWYDYIDNLFWENGYMTVNLNGKYNMLNINEQPRFQIWYDYVGATFDDGYTTVKSGDKENCINAIGKYYSPEWYDRFSYQGNYAIVSKDGKENIIAKGGRVIGKEWYDDGEFFKDGYARINKDGIWLKTDKDGNVISSEETE